MVQEVVLDCAIENHDPDVFVGLDLVDYFLELPDHLRAHDVDGRVVDRHAPIGGRPPQEAKLCSFRGCVHRCHTILLALSFRGCASRLVRGLGQTTAAPALLTTSSCESVPPEQPMAPIILPFSMSGIPPREAMTPSNA